MNVPVLMYHRVCKDLRGSASDFVIRTSTFERQLEWLAEHGYVSTTVAELLAGRATERSVLITFDDGYLDNYEQALPVLEKHGFSATIFLIADFRLRKNFWDEDASTARAPLLEISHIREMQRAGISFGSHGMSHRHMALLDDASTLAELQRSKGVLEDLLGASVTHMAYPYGSVDGRTKSLVRRAGYDAAFAVNSGPVDSEEDPLEIRRVLMSDYSSALYMRTKMSGVEKMVRALNDKRRAFAWT